ncbi:hypothetical protein JXA05_03120 [Candidatus Peregrinibacteria bacterium]|nr:hypothetical protein [Candidatus Peregrinibacteria bacterium]
MAFLLCLTFTQANAGCDYVADARDALSVNEQYKTLLGVKAFLEQNSEKMRYYASLGDEEMVKHAPEINSILLGLIKQIRIAQGAADSIYNTQVRFNPAMFDELRVSLSIAIRKLNSGNPKMRRLFNEAGKMEASRDNWGVRNLIVRTFKDIDSDAVISMVNYIGQLSRLLAQLDKSIVGLSKDGINGCSNNYFVDEKIIMDFGEGRCDVYNSLFCRAMAKAGYEEGKFEGASLTTPETVALQQRMIFHGFLKKYQDDGVFGVKSNKAFSGARNSNRFAEDIRACKRRR